MRIALLTIGLAAAVAPSTAAAQVAIKGGLSFATTTESEFLPDVDTRTGFAIGLSLGLPMGAVASLRPEIYYVQKGGKLSNSSTLKIDELNVPVLLQLKAPVPGFAPFVVAGPQAEYELSCTNANVDCVNTNSLRWGFVAGAGFNLGGLLVEGRYDWTLSRLADDIGSRPRTFLLLLGLGGTS